MMLEFYGLLDLIIFIVAVVLAVVKRKEKTKFKREEEDNRTVSDIYIFMAVIWFPNLVCIIWAVI